MCGIFMIRSRTGMFNKEMMSKILSNFKRLRARGPDAYSLTIIDGCLIGFQRLAINDTSDKGMQPFQLDDTFTICNGEIYNYDDLIHTHPSVEKKLVSKSDCEILPHLFSIYGTFQALQLLDGVFAIARYTKSGITLARDRIGVKPAFYAMNDDFFAVASETKALDGLGFEKILPLSPSTFLTYNNIYHTIKFTSYTSIPHPKKSVEMSYDICVKNVHDLMVNSVVRRLSSDRDIGCLLSGGLDSSVVAAILAKEMKKRGKTLRTFSVGFPDSTDIVYARQVAAHIGSDHHEYVIQYDYALTRIPDVVKAIETYDTTTIRASTPMFLLCEWINQNFPDKVIFSGEGSDELFCGYLYFHNAPTAEDAHNDSIRLLEELYQYDVLRADRCTAGNGLEFREPFLDQSLVNFVVNMNPEFNIPMMKGDVKFEKTILRQAFESYLPESVAWRRKAAFSDAVSSSQKPWYKWIQERVDELKEKGFTIKNYGGTDESNYYKTLFYSNFSDYEPLTPLWLPRWSGDMKGEPSATALNVYKKEEH
jgi:asparagine synthase (glutamine-hydrolysing)